MHRISPSEHDRGALGEQLACEFLVKKGYTIIERNYRIRGGEIDIIAMDGTDVVFIEVKLRRSSHFGYPEEAVGCAKLKRITKAMRAYLHAARVKYSCVRFDIIAMENENNHSTIRHIKDIELPYDVC